MARGFFLLRSCSLRTTSICGTTLVIIRIYVIIRSLRSVFNYSPQTENSKKFEQSIIRSLTYSYTQRNKILLFPFDEEKYCHKTQGLQSGISCILAMCSTFERWNEAKLHRDQTHPRIFTIRSAQFTAS